MKKPLTPIQALERLYNAVMDEREAWIAGLGSQAHRDHTSTALADAETALREAKKEGGAA